MCALQRQSFRMYPALGHVCSLKTREFKDAILDCRPYQRFMHLDLMSEQVPDATTLAKRRHSLERQGLGKAMLHDLNSELEKAGITARGGSIVDVTFTWALKLHEEQRPHTRPLKRTSPRKGGPGVSDTRRISAWMPQVALCMVWRRLPRMYLTYPVAHTLVREDDRFCCADFRLYRYSEAPLRTHKDPHLSSMR